MDDSENPLETTANTTDDIEESVNEETNEILPISIINEEKKLKEANEETERKNRKQFLDQQMSDEELKERRYKRLMHLLQSSEIYSSVLKKKITSESSAQQNDKSTSNSKKSKINDDYKISSVLDNKDLDTVTVKSETNINSDEDQQSSETYINECGFKVAAGQPQLLSGGELRDYQLQGLQWLETLFKNGVNGILADEMGLGKTIQVIAFLSSIIEKGLDGPFLIIAPLSTIPNWLIEFETFAPKVPTLIFHGRKEVRKGLIKKIRKRQPLNGRMVFPVVITSYEVPLMEKKALLSVGWKFLIIDEGHKIKNHCSLLARTVRQFNTLGRLLLTGTPLQNSMSELWALLNFLIPEVFNDLDVFESWFKIEELQNSSETVIEQEKNKNIVSTLHQILRPFLLRRKKSEVLLSLPPKKEMLVYCPLTSVQRDLYQSTINLQISKLLKPDKFKSLVIPAENGKRRKRTCVERGSPRYRFADDPVKDELKENEVTVIDEDNKTEYIVDLIMTNPHMQLRKIVNHPYLVQFPVIPGTREPRIDGGIIKKSGKFLVLDAMLEKLKARGHKVLIFSTFKVVLDLLEEHAIIRQYKYCRFDGTSDTEHRQNCIKEFNSDPSVFLFYVTTRAGGLGINLTAADTVIIFDSDWNPQADLQAQDRCHRIGQTKPVVVYRLCVPGTIDEQIIERGVAKRRLEKIVINDGKFNFVNQKSLDLFSLRELKKLLLSTDHHNVIHSNGFIFTDSELDALLDRSDMLEKSERKPQLDDFDKILKVLPSVRNEDAFDG